MKKQLILFYLLLCITFPAQAGVKDKVVRAIANKAAEIAPQATIPATDAALKATTSAGYTALKSEALAPQVLDTLINRTQRTYKQASALEKQIPFNRALIFGEPFCYADIVEAYPFLQEHYALATEGFLSTQRQTEEYLLSRNNRLFIQELRRMQEDVWPQLHRHIKTLKINAQHFTQPKNPLQFVAQKIEPKIKNLFLTELHTFPEIQQSVLQFLHYLRVAQPEREILLFTEFLPARYEWNIQTASSDIPKKMRFLDYDDVWQTASQNGMHVIGLEDPIICQQRAYLSFSSVDNMYSWWTQLEGMQLRNGAWQQILAEYRANYPDALFVIYTGEAHSIYTAPFSLSAHTPADETFVLSFSPHKMEYPASYFFTRMQTTFYTDPLEGLTNNTVSFPQPLLYWGVPQLAHAAGFDARYKVPVKLPSDYKGTPDWEDEWKND